MVQGLFQSVLIGYCECDCEVYYDEDQERPIYTCSQAPCDLVKDPNGKEIT